MPISFPPYCTTLVASAARTSTSNSGAITLPIGLTGACFFVKVTAASGTSPTLDVAIEVTPDDGTTWFPQWKFTQMTTTATNRLSVKFSRLNEAGEEEASIAYTGTHVHANAPCSQKIRVYWTIAGTNPSLTFAVYMIAEPGFVP